MINVILYADEAEEKECIRTKERWVGWLDRPKY